MTGYISYKETNFFKRFNILGAALLSIIAILETIFMLVTQHYLIISVGSSLVLAVLQGRNMPTNLVVAFMTFIIFVYFVALILDQYFFEKFPRRKGALTLIAGVVLLLFAYAIVFPAIGVTINVF